MNLRLLLSIALCVTALFAVAQSREIPRDTSFTARSTYIKVKKNHPETRLVEPLLPEGVKAMEDITYRHLDNTPYGDRDLHVDIYRPDDDNRYPALLMIHGGGWRSGSRELQRPLAMHIAKEGYVTVPVEYRLSLEAKYPAALHDVKAAIRWLRANADRYGIDPDKIAVSGCSAGGQLAALAGITNGSERHEGGDYDVTSDVQAIVNIDGIVTFVSPENIADAAERLRKKGEMPVNAFWLGGMYDDATANWEEASAIKWVTRRSAPICFINSRLPRYHDGRDPLCEIYDNLGIDHETHELDSDIHPFWFFERWFAPTVRLTVDFLDRHLK